VDLLEDDFRLEEDYLDREMTSEILEMVNRLPARERQVIQGFYLEDLSIGDISKRYGITYRTVINTKMRALKRMRKEMEVRHV
jgi:RNA polymerase sporulation-specific sigma factor